MHFFNENLHYSIGDYNMKLKLKEIMYITQSLQYRAKYYEGIPRYKKYFKELQPLIKKFIKMQGKHYLDTDKLNKKVDLFK